MTVLFKPSHPTGRSCGSCHACCDSLEIESRPGYSTLMNSNEDVAKPLGVRCRFRTAEGCSVYEQRPAVCRNFFCDWLIGRKGFGKDESPLVIGAIGVRGEMFKVNHDQAS